MMKTEDFTQLEAAIRDALYAGINEQLRQREAGLGLLPSLAFWKLEGVRPEEPEMHGELSLEGEQLDQEKLRDDLVDVQALFDRHGADTPSIAEALQRVLWDVHKDTPNRARLFQRDMESRGFGIRSNVKDALRLIAESLQYKVVAVEGAPPNVAAGSSVDDDVVEAFAVFSCEDALTMAAHHAAVLFNGKPLGLRFYLARLTCFTGVMHIPKTTGVADSDFVERCIRQLDDMGSILHRSLFS